MKIVCSQSELAKGISIVSKAVPTRSTMPILECILIDASTNEIKLIANDMEIGIETKINGSIEKRGVIAIEAKFLQNLITKLHEGTIAIETDDNYKVKITCENKVVEVPGKTGEDFPYIPVISRNNPIVLSQMLFKDIVKQTIFSVSSNENNKLMTGELFDFHENNLKVVSLDGNRISIRNVELNQSVEDKKIIIPGKAVNEVSKIIGNSSDEKVNIFITDNHIIFEFDDTIVVSRLIEGEYFKIDHMLSSDYETKITINKKQMLDCIDLATIMANEGDKKPIILTINGSKMYLKIESNRASMNDDIDVKKEGKDLIIGFNPKYLIDALRVIDDEEVSLYMMNTKSPCVIRDDNNSYAYIILPININVN